MTPSHLRRTMAAPWVRPPVQRKCGYPLGRDCLLPFGITVSPLWGMPHSTAKSRAQRQIADKDFQLDLQSALKPGFALQRIQRFMRHGDHVKDPVDQALFRGNF